MNIQQAIMAFSQSEKIKAGIIWASHLAEMMGGFTGHENQAAQAMVRSLIGMVSQEVQLGLSVTGDSAFKEAMVHLDRAMIMIHSGVGHESVHHLTQALSRVTGIGQRSMSFLREEKLL